MDFGDKPVVVGRVSVGNQHNGNGRIVLNRVHSVGRSRVMFLGVGRKRFEKGFPVFCLSSIPIQRSTRHVHEIGVLRFKGV